MLSGPDCGGRQEILYVKKLEEFFSPLNLTKQQQ